MSLRLLRTTYDHLPIPMGAEGENDPTKDEPKDDPEKEGTDDGTDDGDGDGDGDKSKPVTQEAFDKLFQRMQAADRRATAAETKVKEAERAKMDDLQRAQDELKEATDKLQELEGDLKTERLHNAFLASNTITWHDPEMAMTHVNLEGVLKDDGTVDSAQLKKQIQALAKEKPFLVKSEDGGGSGKKVGQTGAGVGTDLGGDKDKNGAASRETLMRKYPALRR